MKIGQENPTLVKVEQKCQALYMKTEVCGIVVQLLMYLYF